jgi:NTE family protein
MKKPFVLSGGGARGFAHLGAIKALKEQDYEPSAIAGVSAGALVGAFIAGGMDPEDVRALFIDQIKLSKMLRWNFLKQGLFTMDQLDSFMQKNLPFTQFEQLPIPFKVSVTDFNNGLQTVFESGPIIPAVLASCSIPAIFPPFTIGAGVYVDGGLVDNMPVSLFVQELDDVIAMHVNPVPPHQAKDSLARIIDRAWHLSTRAGILDAAKQVHLFIEPPELGTFGMFDANKLPEIYQHGYDYTHQLLQSKKMESME